MWIINKKVYTKMGTFLYIQILAVFGTIGAVGLLYLLESGRADNVLDYAIETYIWLNELLFFAVLVFNEKIYALNDGKVLLVTHLSKFTIDFSDDSRDYEINGRELQYSGFVKVNGKSRLYINKALKNIILESLEKVSDREKYTKILKTLDEF